MATWLLVGAAGCGNTDPSTRTPSVESAAVDDPALDTTARLPPTYARSTPADAAAECFFDVDCDRERVCDHGQCVRWWRMKGDVPEVDPTTLYWMVQRGEVQVVDVRTLAEYRLGRIDGAVHVPIQTLPDRIAELGLDPEKPVVAICLTAHRSIAAVRVLSRHGYDVVQLEGGMTAWARSKLPVIRGRDVDVTE